MRFRDPVPLEGGQDLFRIMGRNGVDSGKLLFKRCLRTIPKSADPLTDL